MNDAFIYLWYDAPNKKYYLGVHNGKDPYYTHSAQSSEEFRSIVPHSNRPISERKEFLENIPKGISRKKIAYGTDEEMCELEHKLLVNRKNRCWNRYYNESLGDPRYVDQSGENNSQYTNGMSVGRKSKDPEIRKAADRKREQLPERKEYRRKYDKKRNQTPERKEYMRKYMRERYAREKAETQGEGTLKVFLG